MQDTGRLRQAGLRVTAARLAIMQTVREGDHLDVDAIHRGVCERVGQVSLQAVYDSLNALQRGGLLRRIEPAGSPTRYETRVGDNHHHLVCRRCAKVTDVDCAVGHAPCLDPVSDAGFLVDEADVIYWGLCPDCHAAAASHTADDRDSSAVPAPDSFSTTRNIGGPFHDR